MEVQLPGGELQALEAAVAVPAGDAALAVALTGALGALLMRH